METSLPEGYFKWATLISVLNYMDENQVQNCLSMLSRLLAPSGRIVVVVYNVDYDRERGLLPEANPHSVRYGVNSAPGQYWVRPASQYIDFVERAGFRVNSSIEVPPEHELPGPEALFSSPLSWRPMFTVLSGSAE